MGPEAGKAAVAAQDGKACAGPVTSDPSDSVPSCWSSSTPKSLEEEKQDGK